MENETMTMIKEEPIFAYYGCCSEYSEQRIEIYADELKKAEIGKEWSCSDQDRYPNSSENWNVYVKKVFEDEHGCLLIKRDNKHLTTQRDIPNFHEMIWIQYREK